MTQKNRTSFMNDPLCRIPSFYSEFSLLERPNVQRRHVRLDNKGWCGKVLCSQRGNEEGFNGCRMSYLPQILSNSWSNAQFFRNTLWPRINSLSLLGFDIQFQRYILRLSKNGETIQGGKLFKGGSKLYQSLLYSKH